MKSFNGWIKFFGNGTAELGSDLDIKLKNASWSKGRLDNIGCVEAYYNGKRISISGFGKYWQSDTYKVVVGSNNSQLVSRRIQRLVDLEDKFYYQSDYNSFTFRKDPISKDEILWGIVHPITEKEQNQWFVVELDIENNKINSFFSKNRL